MEILKFALPVTGNFFADVMLWLVNITSSVTVGIILFTLLLKLVTLPFDFASRASMRKNAIKMEEMRPELEKLQAQYAHDKNLYNQKMMALYKKNGYSVFGACLPTILTLVIFIIAINGFTAYSQYQNRKYFYDMTAAYNEVIFDSFTVDGNYITRDENDRLVFTDEIIKGKEEPFTNTWMLDVDSDGVEETCVEDFTVNGTTKSYTIYKIDGYVKAEVSTGEETKYYPIVENLKNNNELVNDQGYTFSTVYNNDFDEYFAGLNSPDTPITKENAEENFASDFIKGIRQTKAREVFEKNNAKFLWVKNIWVTDSTTKHPVESDWKAFAGAHAYPSGAFGENFASNPDNYNDLTAKLADYKSAPNGYFILVILTAGVSLLMQIIMAKGQKAQMELQTVNGQGAQTQKIMMWMMPIMMAVFAFMYTAAFSIYIIVSSIISMLTTVSINFIIDKKYKSKPKKAEVVRGRVYTPKEQPKPQPKKVKVDKDRPMEHDFLAGTADKKKKKNKK